VAAASSPARASATATTARTTPGSSTRPSSRAGETRRQLPAPGQWMVKGTVGFDDSPITEVAPVHLSENGLVLGAGESLEGRRYTRARDGGPVRTLPVPGRVHRRLHSTRWVFGGDNSVCTGTASGSGSARCRGHVNVGYYSGGKCLVEASRDGGEFAAVGEIGQVSTRTFALPAGLFPAREIRIRLRSAAAADRKGDSRRVLPGPCLHLRRGPGGRRHVAQRGHDVPGHRAPDAEPGVSVESLGSLRPAAGRGPGSVCAARPTSRRR